MIGKYILRDEPDKSMFLFERNGKFYGHIIKNKTDKSSAKFVFETEQFGSVELLKEEHPEKE